MCVVRYVCVFASCLAYRNVNYATVEFYASTREFASLYVVPNNSKLSMTDHTDATKRVIHIAKNLPSPQLLH